MSSLIAFFLGILLILVIFIPFWYLGRENATVKPIYDSIFCSSGGSAVRNFS